jgi:phosphoribosylformimino-5-aminoimidazole carboxamide ribonucleotide (ProFAR) isomerase
VYIAFVVLHCGPNARMHASPQHRYAGGGRSIEDLALVDRLSNGRVDLTFGSALDIFGGTGVKYADCVAHNNKYK